jgi:type I restriction enzyme S subunit
MSEQWPTVKLGEVLRLDLDRHSIDAAATYPMVGVLSFGRGLFDREPIENGNTSYRVFYRLKAEHIVMSQLFGWEGALALSSEKFAGKFLSPQFPTFLCDEKTLNREFLGWLMRRPAFWEDLGSRTSGMGDRRRTLNPEALFKCDIPLPPLAEQRGAVARIDELAAKIHEASTLRQQAVEEAEALLVAMAHRSDLDIATKEREGWKRTKLSDVIEEVDDSHVVKTDHSYPNLGMYSFGRGLFHKPPIDGLATSAKSLRRVKEGQFIYSRLFAFEGAYGMVTKEFDGAFVSQEYPTFKCDPHRIRAEFLVAYFKPAHVWKEVAIGSKGLGDRRQRVQPPQILNSRALAAAAHVAGPSVEVRAEVDVLKHLQAETAGELGALLPAILDRAFKGEI